jgi:hypothetical protein
MHYSRHQLAYFAHKFRQAPHKSVCSTRKGVGRQIVEAEQGGAKRAACGQGLLESLSKQLSADYGDGFSLSALNWVGSRP